MTLNNQSNDNDKQKDQHQRSVETLGLSGHGDTSIISKIKNMPTKHFKTGKLGDYLADSELDMLVALLQDEILKARIDEQNWLHLNGNYTITDRSMLGGDKEDYTITFSKEKREARIADLQSQLTKSPKEGEDGRK